MAFGGRRYSSPSGAGPAPRETVTGRKMATGGWTFWRVEVDGKAQTLSDVRNVYLKRGG